MLDFYLCPICQKGSLSSTADAMKCGNCATDFPVFMGIVDFRDEKNDSTEAFSYDDDRQVAKILQDAFPFTTTFNELYDLYKYVRSTGKAPGELPAPHEMLKSQGIQPRLMSSEQLAHGPAILQRVEEHLESTSFKKPNDGIALEDGAGLGFYVDGFSKKFKQVFVIDFSLSYLVLSQAIIRERKLENVKLLCGTVEKLPFTNDTFDFLHSNNVIEHVTDQEALVAEAKRVLKPGALMFMRSPNRYSAYFEPHFRLPFFGFFPKPLSRLIIKRMQNRDISTIQLPSLGELTQMIRSDYGDNYHISFIPRSLKDTVNGGFIRRMFISLFVSKLTGGAANFVFNKLLLGVMPYHTVLAKK